MRTIALLGIAAVLAGANASANVVMLQAQQDNTIFSESNSLSNGAGQYIFTGTTASGFTRRALVQFDLSAIPPGSTINSAQLSLQMSMTIVQAETVELH